jgi:ATPase family protein associated with various cellular activities (AAA)/AAA+ lid domain-containing protein
MDSTEDLRLLLASRHSLIVAEVDDEPRFMRILRRAAQLRGYPVWTWSVASGLVRDGMNDAQMGSGDARRALSFVRQLPDPGVFVFHDLGNLLSDLTVVRTIKEIVQSGRMGQTLVLTGPSASVAAELRGLAMPWHLQPPSREELDALVRRIAGDLVSRGIAVALPPQGFAPLVEAVTGLTFSEAERMILKSALGDGVLDADDARAVRDAKAELLAEDGVLELVSTTESLDRVGGLDGLKAWLAERGRGFEPSARDFGLESPRGVLLTGVPGCGKSLVAKTLARTWGMPLVLFDPGRMYGSYVGESEARLRSALSTVEAMAPVVLWIDELEKGLSTDAAGDSGVSRRVLGTFLRWMQDRPEGVFLVATCNDVRSMPAELLRRGRFDDVFFVDLPGPREREQILRLHLSRRKRDSSAVDVAAVAAATEGFSGAELESLVVGAMYATFADGADLTTVRLLDEAAEAAPLSRSRAEDVAALRAWARGRAIPASAASAAP